MSAGLYRKQYEALTELADDLGLTYSTPDGSFNQKFCAMCRVIVEGLGGTFTSKKGSFAERKSNGLWQVATAIGVSVSTVGGADNILATARAIWDTENDGTTPDFGSGIDWRVYQYLKHSILGPAAVDEILQDLQFGVESDGFTLKDNKAGVNVDEPELRNVNCLSFNGTTSDDISNGLQNPLGDWYCEAMVKPTGGHIQEIIVLGGTASSRYLYLEATGAMRARVSGGFTLVTTGLVPDDAWSLLVSQRVGSTITLSAYEADRTTLRFSEVVSTTLGGPMADDALRIGGRADFFEGLMSSVKITGVLEYPFAEGSGDTFFDVSGLDEHGFIEGATWATDDGLPSYNHLNGFTESALSDYDTFLNAMSATGRMSGAYTTLDTYSAAGAAARTDLTTGGKTWTLTDGGLA